MKTSILRFACITVVLAGISVFQLKAERITINFSTNFDDNYQIYISPIENGQYDFRQIEPLTIDENGDASWQDDLSLGSWIQVVFMPTKRDRQIGASFPLILSKLTEDIIFTYSDVDYITIQSSNITNENKVLIQNASFVSKMLRNRFMASDKESGITFNPEDFLTYADKLIDENKVTEKKVVDYVKIAAYNNFLEGTFYKKNDAEINFPDDLIQVLDNEFLLSVHGGTNNVDSYFNHILRATGSDEDAMGHLARKIELIKNEITTENLSNVLIQSNLSKFISGYRIIDIDLYLSDVKRFEKDVLAVLDDSGIKRKYADDFKNMQYTGIGSDAPDVKFKDLNGNEVSLDMFSGKYIYIDFWASWCGPCIVEAPYLIQLEKDYEDKDIEFVSISVDFDKKAWHKKVAELDLKGNQWESGDSSIEKILNIKGIPHFVIYDANAKLLYYNAPRPSSDEIRKIFDEL